MFKLMTLFCKLKYRLFEGYYTKRNAKCELECFRNWLKNADQDHLARCFNSYYIHTRGIEIQIGRASCRERV